MTNAAKNTYSVKEALHKPLNCIQTGMHVVLILHTQTIKIRLRQYTNK